MAAMSPDEFLGSAPAAQPQQQNQPMSSDEFLGPQRAKPDWISQSYAGAFIGGLSDTFKEEFPDYQDGEKKEHSFMKNVKDAFLNPATTIETGLINTPKTLLTGLQGAYEGISRTLNVAGQPITKAAETVGKATGGIVGGPNVEVGTSLMYGIPEALGYRTLNEFSGIPHAPEITAAKNVASHAIGASEDVYSGLERATPQQAANAYAAAQSLPETDISAAHAEATDIHAIAHNIAPDAVGPYREFQMQKDDIRQQIFDASDVRNKAIQEQIDSITVNKRQLTNKQQMRVDDLRSQMESDTPEMEELRGKLQEIDYKMRDLAPQVSEAYRKAADMIPKEIEAPKPIEESKPVEPETVKAPDQIKAENDDHKTIVDDITKKATAVGYGKEEAEAGAEILARQYRYLAEVYGGEKGSALEFYNKESPEFSNQKAAGMRQDAKGAYKAPAEEARGLLRMFKSADASTLVHEGAHHFLNMLKRFETEAGAPAKLKADMAIVRDWLKVKEDGIFTTRMEERFARGWETYLHEGHAPTKELVPIFQKFEKWLKSIYDAVDKKIPYGKISPQVKDFFDRVLEPNAELRNNPRNTVIAPERETSNVHERLAETTPPEKAEGVADNISNAVERLAKASDKEIADGLDKENAAGTEQATQSPANAAAATGETTGTGQPNTVNTGGSESAAEGAGLGKANEGTQRPAGAKSELVDKAGNIRVENLTSDQDIQDALREVADQNKDFVGATRGVVTDQEVSDLADAMGIQAKEINIQKLRKMSVEDGIPLAVRVRAGRQMLVDSTQAVLDLAKKAMTGSDADALELQKAISRQLMIQETISGVTAEIGRGLRAFQDLSKEKMAEAEQVTELLQRTTGRTPEDVRNIARELYQLKNANQAAEFIKKTNGVTRLDKLFQYRIRCLLWGPVTHAVISIGHGVNAIFKPTILMPAAAGLGRVAEIVTGKESAGRVYLPEAKAQIYAMTKGAENGWIAAKDSWNTRLPLKLPGQPIPKWFGNVQETIPTTKFGKAIEGSTRAITAMHSFFEALRFEQEFQGGIVRQAIMEGLETDSPEFARRIAELDKEMPKEVMDAAGKEALHQLYMDPIKRDDAIKGFLNFSQNNVVGKALFPMVKIEYLIKKMTLGEYTPLGLFSKETRANLAGTNGEAARFMTASKLAVGTSLMGIGYKAAAEGFVNASGPSDPKEYKIWRLTHCPNSLQVGDLCYPLKGLGQPGLVLEVGAHIHEGLQYSKVAPDDNEFMVHTASVVEHVAQFAGDGTFIQQMGNLLELKNNPKQYANQFIQNYAASYLPFSSGLSQTAQLIDRNKRDVRSEGFDNAYGFFDAMKAKIPFASEGLPERFDCFGNPMKVGSNYDQYKDDPVVQKMEDLQIGVGRLDQRINGVKLTNEQWGTYSQLAGQMIHEKLTATITDPSFEMKSKVIQIALINRDMTVAREAARAIIKMEYPGIANQATENKRRILYGE